jgi:hypothetical protein
MRALRARERWLVLGGGLVSAALVVVGAWLGDERAAPQTALVAASAAQSRAGAKPGPGEGARNEAPPVNLEKLKSRALGAASRDPFAAPAARGPKSRRAVPGAAAAAAPPPASAPVLPFTYMGKLLSGGDRAVFLIQGERNLVVHEGDTIDALYRVEHIAEGAITLVYLPLDQRQTLIIGEPQ